MAIVADTKPIKDGSGATFQLGLLKDSVAGTEFDAAAIYDPASGLWATVDAQTRLRASAADAVEVSVGGAQYNLTVNAIGGAVVTLIVPAGATHAWITVDPNSAGTRLRYTKDGSTTPTAANGHSLELGDEKLFTALGNLKFIGEGGALILQVTYVHF